MPDHRLDLDGNAAAGLLGEILAVDATTVVRRCPGCGERHPIATHTAWQGAGWVLRCPGCGAAGVTVAVSETVISARLHGTFTVAREASG